MTNQLETTYAIDHWEISEEKLVVRLVPDYYFGEIVDPVVVVTVLRPTDVANIETQLKRWASDPIVEVDVLANALVIYAEYDAILTVHGQASQMERSKYTTQDLAAVIVKLEQRIDESYESLVAYRNRLHETEQFTSELLRRAKTKRSLSATDTAILSAQIDVLERVISRLQST